MRASLCFGSKKRSRWSISKQQAGPDPNKLNTKCRLLWVKFLLMPMSQCPWICQPLQEARSGMPKSCSKVILTSIDGDSMSSMCKKNDEWCFNSMCNNGDLIFNAVLHEMGLIIQLAQKGSILPLGQEPGS